MPGLDWKKLDKINIDTLDTVLRRILCNTFWNLLSDEEKVKAIEERVARSVWRGAYNDGAEYAYNQWTTHPAWESKEMYAVEMLYDRCQDMICDYELGILPEENEDTTDES